MTTMQVIRDRSTVNEAGCWIYRRAGRSKVRHDGRDQYVYRVAWQLVNGPIPDGLMACHHCDEPRCCNPEHLFLGTVRDNSRDMVSKGRLKLPGVRGEAHPAAHVSDQAILAAREEWASGLVSQAVLAERLGVTQTTVSRWMRGAARVTARVSKAVAAPPCGTRAGYVHHRRKLNETPCQPCREATRAYMAEYRRQRRLVRDVAA